MANLLKKLPKAVLDMKFMKKTKEKIEREKANTEGHEPLYSSDITNEMRQATGNFVTEPSFIFCEDLLEGRLSFKGMNPEIERLMENESNGQKNQTQDMEKDVSDEILAKKMASLKRKHSFESPGKNMRQEFRNKRKKRNNGP